MLRSGLIIFLGLSLAGLSGPAGAQSNDERSLGAAARECRPAEVAELLDKGVNVNARISDWTPLMYAATDGCTEVVRLLLKAGADTTLKHPQFGDAAALAQANRYPALQAMIIAARGAAAGPAQVAAVPGAEPTVPRQPAPAVATAAAGAGSWPELGAYQVGQKVLWSGTGGKTWRPGEIKALDPKYGYSIVDGPSGSYNRYSVVAPQREPFWTSYFIGDWRVSVPMATGLVTDGRDIYRTVSGGMRLPPLRINANGTYSWRVQQRGGERLIQGRWEPNSEGPGVILKNAEQGADWLVYNNTDALSTLGETVILSSACCTYYDGSRIR